MFENEVWINLELSFYRDIESYFTSRFGFYKYVEYLVQTAEAPAINYNSF